MDVEAERWQHDLWYRVLGSGVGDAPEQVRLDDMPGFEKPAVSRYAARLLRWFERHNRGKPFGFLLAYQPNPLASGRADLKPVSAYYKDAEKAVSTCFDQRVRRPGACGAAQELPGGAGQYYLHPEVKFRNGV